MKKSRFNYNKIFFILIFFAFIFPVLNINVFDFQTDNILYAGNWCWTWNPDTSQWECKEEDPSFISRSKRNLDPNFEKPLLNLTNGSINKVIVTYDKNLIKNDAGLQISSSVPSWLTISGLDNVIDYDDEELSAIELTIEVSDNNLPNTYAEIKFNLIDHPDLEIKSYKVLRIAIEKTLAAEIYVPNMDSLVRASVPLFGYAFGELFDSYTIKYGQGLAPANWTIITNSSIEKKNNIADLAMIGFGRSWRTLYGNLGNWNTGLTAYEFGIWNVDLNGLYTVRLEVSDINGNTIAEETVVQVGKIIVQSDGGIAVSPDKKVEIIIPPFAVDRNFKIIALDKALYRFTKNLVFTNLNYISDIYEIRAPGNRFMDTVSLKFYYNEEDLNLDSRIIEENDLCIYVWNTQLTQWTYVGGVADTNNNYVITKINKTMSDYAFYSVVEDPYPPSKPIVFQPDTPTIFRNIEITGKSDPGSIVKIFLNGMQNIQANSDLITGVFTAMITNLKLGTNIITAKAIDYRGRISLESVSVVVELILNPPLLIQSVKYMNDDFSAEYSGDIRTWDNINIELIGIDSSSDTVDSADVKIISIYSDPNGINMQLIETGINTGIYRGNVVISSESISYLNKLKAGYHTEIVRTTSLDDITKIAEIDIIDDIKPEAPEILSLTHPSLIQNTFEVNLGQWANKGGNVGAIVERDNTTSDSGKFSAKVINETDGGYITAYVLQEGFDAKMFPSIKFDYKISQNVKIDFFIYINDKWYFINLTGDIHTGWAGAKSIFSLPAIDDNQWHSMEFNIYNILKKNNPDLKSFYINELTVGNAECFLLREGRMKAGTYFNIDNFNISKSYNDGNPIFKWETLWDGSGISDYSYVLDHNKYTLPDTAGEGLNN